MGARSHYLTENDLGILAHLKDWKIWDIPPNQWDHIPPFHRRDDAIAVFANGCFSDPKRMNEQLSPIGFDIVVHEEIPTKKGEENINVYHFVIEKMAKPIEGDKLFRMVGPYRGNALTPHYPSNQEALDFYSSVGTLYSLPDAKDSVSFESVLSQSENPFPIDPKDT